MINRVDQWSRTIFVVIIDLFFRPWIVFANRNKNLQFLQVKLNKIVDMVIIVPSPILTFHRLIRRRILERDCFHRPSWVSQDTQMKFLVYYLQFSDFLAQSPSLSSGDFEYETRMHVSSTPDFRFIMGFLNKSQWEIALLFRHQSELKIGSYYHSA